MRASEIMNAELPVVMSDAGPVEIAQEMLKRSASHVMVTNGEGKLIGLVSGFDLRRAVAESKNGLTAVDIMTPRSKLVVAFQDTPVDEVARILTEKQITQMPVVKDEVPVGYLNLSQVLKYTTEKAEKTKDELLHSRQAALLINSMREGVVVVDKDYCIRELNPAAEESSGFSAEALVGRQSKAYMAIDSPVRKVMENGEPLYNVEVQNGMGKVYLTNNVPIMDNGTVEGVLQTFSDITEVKQMHFQLLKTRDELEKAFALTLPNSRVEKKLKSTPEYRDIYNADTGMIEVTEVIEDGGYLHVVNALKVAADLNEKGMMSLLGVDKDTLVQALIFHDVGKSQPVLNVGQVVDPRKVFEQSELHALRSADIVETYYKKPQDVVQLIRYHHHKDEDLPDDFPSHLLPMLRLIRIIDGLSAGLTRRNARVGFRANGSRLTILENNGHPDFNRTVEVDLYTGRQLVYTEKKVDSAKREALN
ncbi:MAG: CBS domain-containing protein [Clostridiales bacterium]|nr:CBS domain-containing protein [Clostridiales bacterium]